MRGNRREGVELMVATNQGRDRQAMKGTARPAREKEDGMRWLILPDNRSGAHHRDWDGLIPVPPDDREPAEETGVKHGRARRVYEGRPTGFPPE
jgi:hypothetical protein